MNETRGDPAAGSGRRILTVPNAISMLRIALIPVFFALITNESSTATGLILFGVVMATDWVDGTIARRTGQVSEFGKVLDPVADRLAIAAGIIALVIRGVFPLWAAVLILARDLVVFLTGSYVLSRYRARLESELMPVGEVEIGLVRRIALNFVRLRRAAAIEAELSEGHRELAHRKRQRRQY